MKFTPRNGSVKVSTRDEVDHVRVAVQDSGIGMTGARVRAPVRAVSQGPRTTKQATGGSGLGLYISRAIVQMHGGTADAMSAGPGKGSTFSFTLPKHKASEEPEPVKHAATPRP